MKEIKFDPKEVQNWQLILPDIEKDFTLLGVTGVEDLLQEDVGQCISDFQEAGIKVWMLTGDKGETAQQIGQTCNMFNGTNLEIYKIEENDKFFEDKLESISKIEHDHYGFLIAGN